MHHYVAGSWRSGRSSSEVLNPYDQAIIDTVPVASENDVEDALAAAVKGASDMRKFSLYDRSRVLTDVAGMLGDRSNQFARIISMESGKTIREAEMEVQRAIQTLLISSSEAKQVFGETLPLDADPRGHGKMGFTMRVPCGVVVAISPFNFPLNLVCHKVGPAIAAGNAVILKPATDTPLTALKLTELFLEAGLPDLGLQCLTGSGSKVGQQLCKDPRVRKITFTGSVAVGEAISHAAGIKKLTLELGSNCAVIVARDADLTKAVAAVTASGYANAGQVCISAQRILVHQDVYEEFSTLLCEQVSALHYGNPLEKGVDIGPLIRPSEAQRVLEWLNEAASQGAKLLTGGSVIGNGLTPAVISDISPNMKMFREELFGPAVGLTSFKSIDEALNLANDSRFGLAASIFTESLSTAWQFARLTDAGNLHINDGPSWRADLMPYGGLKASGIGREGPRYAVADMTESKTIVFH